ncbi:hypothetical protein D1872_284390 [compost metagenome]
MFFEFAFESGQQIAGCFIAFLVGQLDPFLERFRQGGKILDQVLHHRIRIFLPGSLLDGGKLQILLHRRGRTAFDRQQPFRDRIHFFTDFII